MTNAIAALLNDEELARRLAARAREIVLERHAPEGRMRRLVEIYRRLAGGGNQDFTAEALSRRENADYVRDGPGFHDFTVNPLRACRLHVGFGGRLLQDDTPHHHGVIPKRSQGASRRSCRMPR
jgi:hypothetical protein